MHFSTDLNAPIYVSRIIQILDDGLTKTSGTVKASAAMASIQARWSSRSVHSAHCVWWTSEIRIQEL